MADIGDLRFSDGRWEILVGTGSPDRFGTFRNESVEWAPLSSVSADDAQRLAPFDDVRTGVQGLEFRRAKAKATDPETWIGEGEVSQAFETFQEEEKGLPARPTDWVGPWPPRDDNGAIDWAEVRKATKETAKVSRSPSRIIRGEEVGGPPGSYFIQTPDGDLRPYTPPAAKGSELPLSLQAENARFRDRQSAQPSSITDLITQALIAGDWDKAIVYDDFQQRPSSLEMMRMALQYGETPEEFDAIMAFGQQSFRPPSLQTSATRQGPDMSFLPPGLGGQRRPGTSAELQAEGEQRAQVLTRAPFNRSPEDVAYQSGVGRERAAQIAAPRADFLAEAAMESDRFQKPKTAAQIAAESEGQAEGERQYLTSPQAFEESRMAREGPNLSDVPEFKGRHVGTVQAPPGVIVPEFVQRNPSVSFYNPDANMQLLDYTNALDESMAGVPGAPRFTMPEGVTKEDILSAKRRSLGLSEPRAAATNLFSSPKIPGSFFERRKKKEIPVRVPFGKATFAAPARR